MKKILCKSLSALLVLIMLLSSVPMLVFAEDKNEAPVFTVDTVEETPEKLTLKLSVTSGSFVCFDATVTVDGLTCTSVYITDDFLDYELEVKHNGGSAADCTNAENGKVSVSVTEACAAPMDIVIYEFEKDEKAGVNGSDVNFTLDSCYIAGDEGEVSVKESATAKVALPETHVHSVEWTVDKEATCTENGSKSSRCLTCGAELETKVINKTGHVHTHEETLDPKCTEAGYYRVYCDDCKTYITNQTFPATGHSEETIVDKKDKTCTEDGYIRYRCKTCNEVIEERILKCEGHKYVNYIIEATCTEKGHEISECSICHDVKSDKIIPAKGHSWTSWSKLKDPTYTSAGTERRACRNCEEFEDRDIPALIKPAESVKMNLPEITMHYKKVTRLYANVMPEEAAYSNEIVWKSSNPAIASVDENGTVTAHMIGKVIITASTKDGKVSDTCEVKVTFSVLQFIIVFVLFGWIWYL